jgi:hypothetical protein
MSAVEAVVFMTFQLYRGGDRERDQRTRQWRAERIKRFTKRQRRTRDWINFSEIAEWCSKEDQSIVPNEEKSAVAFDTLASDLLAGEFEEGRSRVLYLRRDRLSAIRKAAAAIDHGGFRPAC